MREHDMFRCPEKYQDKLFLTPTDIKEIMGLGNNLTYTFLKNAEFRTEKIGGKLVIFANSFWDWYNGELS